MTKQLDMAVCGSKPPIRLLYLIEHLDLGGAERTVVDLAKRIDKNKFQVTVCLYRDYGIFYPELKELGIKVIFLQKDILSRYFKALPFILRIPFFIIESMIFVFRLKELIEKNKINIVHSFLFSGNLWGRVVALLSGRFIMITSERTTTEKRRFKKHIIINKLLAPFSDLITANSHAVAKIVVKNQNVIPEKIVVIPNALKFCDQSNRNILFNPNKPKFGHTRPLLIAVGRLERVKRFDLLLYAIKNCLERFPEINCWLIGDGKETKNLKDLVKKLGLDNHITFLGTRTDVRLLVTHADLMVSTSEREGFPMAILEAISENVPVVATDVGGTKELVENDISGILVEPNNLNSITDGIYKMLKNKNLAKKLADTALEEAKKKFSMESIIVKWEDLYTQVCNS